MSLNPAAELLDLAAVHAFYLDLLENTLGHAVPVPAQVGPAASGADTPHQSIAAMKEWLDLLDMAIAAPLLRDGLKVSTSPETAEALLRHFIRKRSESDVDRDKADFVATSLYRLSVAPNRQFVPENVEMPTEFEEHIHEMLAGEEFALPAEHAQLLREFPFIVQEIEEFRDFDQLMESGVVQRVRDLKQRFRQSLYHPRVLAVVAAYNVFFGKRFDELFRQTARQIKKFAEKVQEQGGSISTRVEGDVTIKHLADVEEDSILKAEYGKAQERFRTISKFKKAVDKRSASRPPASGPPPRPAAQPEGTTPWASSTAPPAAPPLEPMFVPASAPVHAHEAAGTFNPLIEEGKLRAMHDSIFNFMQAADPRSASVFPLRRGAINLFPAEIEAYRNEYVGEKSFRADYATAMRQLVALQACIMTELQDFQDKQNSAYLWKPHADSLTFLLSAAQKLQQQCDTVLATAQQRGLAEKINSLNASLQRLRAQVQNAAKGLQKVGNVAG